MKDIKDLAYEPLSESPDNESFLSDASTFNALAESRLFSYRKSFFVILSILFAVAFVAFGFFGGVKYSERETRGTPPSDLIWSDGLRKLNAEWTRFNGSLYFTSKFRGPPSKEVDDEWDRFTNNEWVPGTAAILNVTREDLDRSRNTASADTTVYLDQANGGGYMGTLEVFHQLHCLNMLRKWTHIDHYREIDPFWRSEEYHLRDHADHCIDILRQVLMCNSDTGLVTYHWVEKIGAPTPDFSTAHRCRDPEQVLAWANEKAAPLTHHIWKNGGETQLPYIP